MAHRSTLAVRFNEIDPYGHVNHSVYVTYLEVGRTEALAHCGVSLEHMAERGIQMVVTTLEVRFRSPARGGETVIVETELGEMRRASGVWNQRILRIDDGPDGNTETELVTASVTAAVTDRTGRPIRPPDWLFPALAPLGPAGQSPER